MEGHFRDSLGIRPLYKFKGHDGVTLYSDSIKELVDRGVPRKLSKKGLMSYLAYGAVQEPMTIIDGVECVSPTWTPSFVVKNWAMEAASKEVSDVLDSCVCDAMAKQASPAAFLSGGIDSSAIVAVMRRNFDGPIRTFCVTHEDSITDERKWAQLVAQKNHTDHTELFLSGRLVSDTIVDVISSYDQPTVDGLNNWYACKLAKEAGCDCCLSGTGGDEVFMGYGAFIKHRQAYLAARWLRHFPRAIGAFGELTAPNGKISKLFQLMGQTTDPYYFVRRIYSKIAIGQLLKRELLCESDFPMLGGDAPVGDDLNNISWKEIRTSLLSMYLRDAYQVGSFWGFSFLCPLLDVRLVELLFSMPGALKVDANIPKHLLVRAAGEGIPRECYLRRKMGFTLPYDRYFRGEIKERLRAFYVGGESKLFNKGALAKIKLAYDCGAINWSRLWAPFVVETWCEINRIEL